MGFDIDPKHTEFFFDLSDLYLSLLAEIDDRLVERLPSLTALDAVNVVGCFNLHN